MAIWVSIKLMNPQCWAVCSPSLSSSSSSIAVAATAVEWKKQQMGKPCLAPANCTPPLRRNLDTQQQNRFQLQQQQEDEEEDVGIMCEPCNGRGWLICGFCNGQKTDVRAENNRIYRRCPSCRAIGYVLCSKCKVFKCVTFPDYSDGPVPNRFLRHDPWLCRTSDVRIRSISGNRSAKAVECFPFPSQPLLDVETVAMSYRMHS